MSRKSRKNTNVDDNSIRHANNDCFSFKTVKAKTEGQQKYIDAIKNSSITMVYGPAGAGKTLCAAGLAVESLRKGQIQKIILSRPIIEACNENLGYLPGNIDEKVESYLVPLVDALEHFASEKEIEDWMSSGVLEVLPIAYMRGRNLHNCYCIIDEAQNLNHDQFKLILSRIGRKSTMIFAGDVKQSDLVNHKRGAFVDYLKILNGLPFVSICELTKDDIIRSPLIAAIMDRIEEFEENREKLTEDQKPYYLLYRHV